MLGHFADALRINDSLPECQEFLCRFEVDGLLGVVGHGVAAHLLEILFKCIDVGVFGFGHFSAHGGEIHRVADDLRVTRGKLVTDRHGEETETNKG